MLPSITPAVCLAFTSRLSETGVCGHPPQRRSHDHFWLVACCFPAISTPLTCTIRIPSQYGRRHGVWLCCGDAGGRPQRREGATGGRRRRPCTLALYVIASVNRVRTRAISRGLFSPAKTAHPFHCWRYCCCSQGQSRRLLHKGATGRAPTAGQ